MGRRQSNRVERHSVVHPCLKQETDLLRSLKAQTFFLPLQVRRRRSEEEREREREHTMTDTGDSTAPFFGFIGAAAALVFSSMGAAYGTAKSGVGIAAMGVMRPELVMKSIVPVVMAGVLGIYGFIISVLIA